VVRPGCAALGSQLCHLRPGAAEQLRAARGCRPPPAARATYERAVALAHAQLGDEAFTAAWAAGEALTLERVIAEALADA
jgi:hypothetical protein